MNLMIVHGILVCISFLIGVCMFIVSKALLISSATVIGRAWGAIWLNPFAMVLFNVCSSVIVDCCVLYPCCVSVFGMFAVMYGRRRFSSVYAITERRDMGVVGMGIFLGLCIGMIVYIQGDTSIQHHFRLMLMCQVTLVATLHISHLPDAKQWGFRELT